MSFGWDSLLASHSIRGQLEICKKTHTRQEQETKGCTKNGWREKWTAAGFIGLRGTSRFTAVKDPFTAEKRASLLRTRGLASILFSFRSDVASFVAMDQKAEIVFFLPFAATKQASPRRTRKMGPCFSSLLI